MGYNQVFESDILLLDISNNDGYIWATNFDSPMILPSSSPIPSSTISVKSTSSPHTSITSVTQAAQPGNSSNNERMIGAIVGSLFGGSLLASGGFLLYIIRNKNK